MKPHEHLFLSRHIAMGRGGIEKVIEYLQDYLPATFTHPLKTMEDCDMFSFLCGVLQVYLEFGIQVVPIKNIYQTFHGHHDVYKMSVLTW